MEDEVIVNAKVEGADESQVEIDRLAGSVKSLTTANANLLAINKQLEAQGKKDSQEYKDNAAVIQNNQQAISKNTAERKVLVDGMKNEEEQQKKSSKGLDDYSGKLTSLIPGFDGLTGAMKTAGNAMSVIAKHPILLALGALVLVLSTLFSWFTRTEEGGDTLAKIMAQLSAIFNVLADRVASLGGAIFKFFTGDPVGAFNDLTKAVSGLGDEIAREVEEAGKLAEILDDLEDKERSYKVAVSETANEIKRLVLESKNRLLTEQQKIALLEQARDLELNSNKELLAIKATALDAAIRQLQMDQSQFELTKKIGETDRQFAKRLVDDSRLMGDARDKVADALIKMNEAEGESLNLQEKIANAIDNQNQKYAEKIAKLEELRKKQEDVFNKEYAALEKEMARRQATEEEIKAMQDKRAKKEDEKRADKSMKDASAALAEINLQNQVAQNQLDIIERLKQEEAQAMAEKIANYEAAVMATLDVLSGFYNMSAELQNMRLKNEKDQLTINENEKLAAIQKRLDNGLISEDEAKKETLKVEKEFDKAQTDLKRQAFESNKKNQIIQTGIDVTQAAMAAFRALVGVPFVGPVLAAAASAAAIVFGNQKIQEIKKQQFVGAEGGMVPGRWTTLGGQYHNGRNDRGTQFYGSDGTRFLAEKDEGLFILKRSAHADFIRSMSARNQRHGGRSWADGGGHYEMGGNVVTVAAGQTAQSEQQLIDLMLSAIANQPAPRVLVDDIDNGLSRKVEVENNANMLG